MNYFLKILSNKNKKIRLTWRIFMSEMSSYVMRSFCHVAAHQTHLMFKTIITVIFLSSFSGPLKYWKSAKKAGFINQSSD